uniref:Uncharacterized protein n=1 Tax=Hyaloperonospora arabidopsidis (strain Emoy2) TaxID=559515 RepID=M4BMV8_HYAAE
MFEALQESMRTSTGPGHLEVWRQTIQELFEVEYSRLPVRSDALPEERKRFPKLMGHEKDSLLDLFRQCFVVSSGTFTDWKRLATKMDIIRKLASLHKWATAPVPDQWARVVRRGSTNVTEGLAGSPPLVYEEFMFDPAEFSVEVATKLRTLCTARFGPVRAHRLRRARMMNGESPWA